jgi:hypothetical protein
MLSMKFRCSFTSKGIFRGLILVHFAPAIAAAQFTMDWDLYDATDWADGDLSGTFTDLDGSGIDLFVEVALDTSFFNAGRPRIRSVDANSPYGEKFFQTGNIDFDASSRLVTATFSFRETGTLNPVNLSSLSFQLFDLDTTTSTDPNLTGYNDQLTLSGSPTFSEVVPAGRTNPTHIFAGSTVMAWDGTLPWDTNAVPSLALNDLEGAVNVAYTNGESSFSYTYTNGPGNLANPVAQNVGIYDINFTPVPEPASALLLAGGFACLCLVRQRRRLLVQRGGSKW